MSEEDRVLLTRTREFYGAFIRGQVDAISMTFNRECDHCKGDLRRGRIAIRVKITIRDESAPRYKDVSFEYFCSDDHRKEREATLGKELEGLETAFN
jgi:hypothetical protein